MPKLYILVAGSRTFSEYSILESKLDIIVNTMKELLQLNDIENSIVIVEGGARGADELAGQYADNHGFEKKIFHADWTTHGKKAGFLRNAEMHKFITANSKWRICVCFWDGESRGTKHNFSLAADMGTMLLVYDMNGNLIKEISHI